MKRIPSRNRDTQGEYGHVKTEAEIGMMLPQPMNTWGHYKLEETRYDLMLEASQGS